MKDPNKLWYDLCKRFADQSQCRSRKVGCIVVQDNVIIGEGWNSPPYGSHQSGCIRCNEKHGPGQHLELAMCAHAETNAIGFCARKGHPTEGATMYCTHICCKYCADLIIAAGIKEYVYIDTYPGYEMVMQTLENAGVIVNRLVLI